MTAPRLLFDEDINANIVDGLLTRVPAGSIATARDVGLGKQHDRVLLAWAAAHDTIVVTHDTTTMTRFANERVEQRERMPGVIVVPQWLGIGPAIDELLIILGASDAAEWFDRVVFLPLK